MLLNRLCKSDITRISSIIFRNFYQELNAADTPLAKVQIKHAKYLPGSQSNKLPDYISTRDHESLKIIRVDQNTKDIEKKAAEFIEKNINTYAAILIKGFHIENANDLQKVTKHLPYQYMNYSGGSGFREEVTSNIYTASEEPKEFTIELHNEMSNLSICPSKILFCCIEEGSKGGESPLSFNRDISRSVKKNVYEKFVKKKIKYMRNLRDEKHTDYLTWQYTFETNDKAKAEQDMEKQGMTWEWMDNGDLCIYNFCEAIREHPVTKETVWFNQPPTCHYSFFQQHPMFESQDLKPSEYPLHCQYGDGEEIEYETMEHLREVLWKNAIPLKLQKGDILFLDNYLCQHARMGFEGNRKILVNLFE